MKKFIAAILAFTVCVFVVFSSACAKTTGNQGGETDVSEYGDGETDATDETNGKEPKYAVVYAQTMSDRVKNYRADSFSNIGKYVVPYSADMVDETKPFAVRFDWTEALDGKTYSEYDFHLAEDEDFSMEDRKSVV